MAARINPKEASVIIKSLEAGVVPNMGVQHLLVGRNKEVEEVIKILDFMLQIERQLLYIQKLLII